VKFVNAPVLFHRRRCWTHDSNVYRPDPVGVERFSDDCRRLATHSSRRACNGSAALGWRATRPSNDCRLVVWMAGEDPWRIRKLLTAVPMDLRLASPHDQPANRFLAGSLTIPTSLRYKLDGSDREWQTSAIVEKRSTQPGSGPVYHSDRCVHNDAMDNTGGSRISRSLRRSIRRILFYSCGAPVSGYPVCSYKLRVHRAAQVRVDSKAAERERIAWRTARHPGFRVYKG